MEHIIFCGALLLWERTKTRKNCAAWLGGVFFAQNVRNTRNGQGHGGGEYHVSL